VIITTLDRESLRLQGHSENAIDEILAFGRFLQLSSRAERDADGQKILPAPAVEYAKGAISGRDLLDLVGEPEEAIAA
jgi:hypothetical protein